jgi:dihydrofolate reductase
MRKLIAAMKNILVGSTSLIVALANLGVIDEFQIGIHPTIVGSGLQLFKNIELSSNS